MIDIGLTETVKSDPLKFGLWLQNKSEFFTLQAASEDIKKCWVQEIRRLLQSQFSKVKGISFFIRPDCLAIILVDFEVIEEVICANYFLAL